MVLLHAIPTGPGFRFKTASQRNGTHTPHNDVNVHDLDTLLSTHVAERIIASSGDIKVRECRSGASAVRSGTPPRVVQQFSSAENVAKPAHRLQLPCTERQAALSRLLGRPGSGVTSTHCRAEGATRIPQVTLASFANLNPLRPLREQWSGARPHTTPHIRHALALAGACAVVAAAEYCREKRTVRRQVHRDEPGENSLAVTADARIPRRVRQGVVGKMKGRVFRRRGGGDGGGVVHRTPAVSPLYTAALCALYGGGLAVLAGAAVVCRRVDIGKPLTAVLVGRVLEDMQLRVKGSRASIAGKHVAPAASQGAVLLAAFRGRGWMCAANDIVVSLRLPERGDGLNPMSVAQEAIRKDFCVTCSLAELAHFQHSKAPVCTQYTAHSLAITVLLEATQHVAWIEHVCTSSALSFLATAVVSACLSEVPCMDTLASDPIMRLASALRDSTSHSFEMLVSQNARQLQAPDTPCLVVNHEEELPLSDTDRAVTYPMVAGRRDSFGLTSYAAKRKVERYVLPFVPSADLRGPSPVGLPAPTLKGGGFHLEDAITARVLHNNMHGLQRCKAEARLCHMLQSGVIPSQSFFFR